MTTKDALLTHGKALFWVKGYGNVSVRDITGAAGVDGALISRYFGGKLGLFEATLETMDLLDVEAIEGEEALVALLVQVFDEAERAPGTPSAMTLALANAHDPEAWPLVNAKLTERWTTPLTKLLGSEARAAMVTCTTFGMSVGEKMLHLPGIHPPGSEAYRAQVAHMLRAALAFPG